MSIKIRFISIISVLFLSGCSLFISESYFGEGWTGHHIDELMEHWGEPNHMMSKEDGVVEVEYKIFSNTCTYIFITNDKGVISSYKYESTFLGTCKPIG